ncbi:hypothetical protein LTR53_000802 [Teratosphaeriaceae sp. CCFEE 6253]|nr:hypothetical protein LTR53_000802 [Teratosphaeriaceae sp. CCFEE 6253]
MAGGHIPGSSERCDQCKQRRKKCDLQTPQCARCRRGNRDCSGPKSKTLFIHRQTDSFSLQTQRQALVEAYRDRSVDPTALARPSPEESYEAAVRRIERLRAALASYQWRSALTKDFTALSASRALLGTTYAALQAEFDPEKEVGIFSGDRVDSASSVHYSNVAKCIRALLPLVPGAGPMLSRSIFSILALYYGLLHSNAGLADLARAGYTAVLGLYTKHLGRAMLTTEHERQSSSDVFMYTSFALQAFEHINDVDVHGTGHLAHIDGALSFVEKLGPSAMQRSASMALAFSGFRGIAVFVAIERRRPCFLIEPEWIRIPFMGREKAPRDCLNDLGLEVPGHQEAADRLLAGARSGILSANKVIDQCLNLLNDISNLRRRVDDWLYTLELSIAGPLYRPAGDPVVKPIDTRDTECKPEYTNNSNQLEFSCGPIAGILVHYWSFQLELLTTAIGLQEAVLRYDKLGDASPVRRATQPALERDRGRAGEVAQLILQGEPRLGSCLEGLLCVQSPLRSVARHLERRRAVPEAKEPEYPGGDGQAPSASEEQGHNDFVIMG